MTVKLFVPKESASGEKRVAMAPAVVDRVVRLGTELSVQAGAGAGSRIPDSAFEDKGAKIVKTKASPLKSADVVLRVAPPTAADIKGMKAGSILASFVYTNRNPDVVKALAEAKVTTLAMELIPRITRAQAMDALSSQAAVAGYKAALIAASELERFLPMLTTAAGTIRPAKVLVIGAGVAGLQAIATARRLGAMVEAYDVRTAAKEQVESLGAKFVMADIKADAEGGYARELTDEEKAAQQAMLEKHIAAADAVITTAAIPGRPSPKIISKAMVESMKSGAVIVDLAAEGGGNCELSEPGSTTTAGEVTICAPLNVPSMLSEHASEMYARNLLNLMELFIKDGELTLDLEDDVIKGALLTHDGEVVNEQAKQILEGSK
ncbi:MAG: Re/Si-specific NAD(P)(+) transhydrogenase subunit alpha [Abyssibacter sp.]|uniref:Re/Si-specific NAD(P)(+) transhydrogenase subunit alpha n=1 Tax=Abyssibacter sp. TaxID=2320200 RepID=UPI002EA2086A|nr:Re/Si-specific NAD(P)(+) transhydrogenase subunit alpha [Pseudomonadota bacterium]